MQARLALIAGKFNRSLLFGDGKQFPVRIMRGCANTSGRTADPAEHAVEEEDVYPSEAIQDERRRRPPRNEPTSKANESYVPPNPPKDTAAKLESTGVGPRTDPILQQKRRKCSSGGVMKDISCAGIDGSPWPEEAEREEAEMDDKEFYKHHKASPLSEIEISDTRKPVTQATDGTAHSETVGYDGNYGNWVWRPEQQDTAEESLRRAADIFRWNAMRGDPDSPHGRVLRRLCGEDW